jgi:hypothetical protein
MSISYEMFGIIATFVILGSCLAVATATVYDFDLGTSDVRIPNITASTNTQPSGYYEWCYQFERDCK